MYKNVFLLESAKIHQGGKQFGKSSNTQCTAMATLSIVALSVTAINDITRDYFTRIVIHGDTYYNTCKTQNKVSHAMLNTDELLPVLDFFGRMYTIFIHLCDTQELNDPNLKLNVTRSIEKCISAEAQRSGSPTGGRSGFLFVTCGKAMAFKVITSNPSFVMFNSHNVDLNNQYPRRQGQVGCARLFQCLTAESLSTVLLADCGRPKTHWQIHVVRMM